MIPIGIIFNYILLIFLSWVFIHLMAGLGIFFALSYLIFWIFIPDKIPDFLSGAFGRKKDEMRFQTGPETFLSALGNFFLIIFVSILSIGLVWVESRLLFNSNLLNLPFAKKSAYFSIPPKGQYRLGEIFPMEIELVDLKTSINAVQVDVDYNPNRLELVKISTKGSFANVFIQKEIDNEAGYARLTGGVPNPGYTGSRGLFATFYFKGTLPGLAKVEFLPTSMVLANDGQGNNVLSKLSTASFLIMPEKISQEEREQQQVMFEARVLGKSEDTTQLRFYEQGSVLGEESDTQEVGISNQEEKLSKNLFTKIGWGLKRLDESILSFWLRIFNLFGTK